MNESVPGASPDFRHSSGDGRSNAQASRPLLTELVERVAEMLKGMRRNSSMRESLEEVIEESEREAQELHFPGTPDARQSAELRRVGGSDVMVPRADIIAVEEQTSLSELIAVFREAQHSRLPVYRETLDDPLGMIHIKDVLALVETGADGQPGWPQSRLPN